MSIRDKLSRASSTDTPTWLSGASNTTKELYQSALQEFIRLKQLISGGGNISLKDRKINQSSVARNANKDKSILSMRRQPELMEWINQKNVELSLLLARFPRHKIKSKSATTLKSEITKLKEINNAKVLEGLRSFVETILSSNLLSDRDLLARENIRLKKKIDTLNNQIINLQDNCNQQAIQIAKLKAARSKVNLTIVPDTES
ncbi:MULTISPECIES: hypothetical protein [Pseudomonas]|uniref:hypothetical protein n=1 Tax=Pseudomonas TaxID=286 RepID=UPI00235F9187|nr:MULTISPECIES: hypothetical protein [Pseudomonas]WJV23202.1 hypothetical protein PSR66_26790 [Pseudomonas chlororaphis]